MSLFSVEIFQPIAWLLALAELIVALYVLVLNAWHTANRHVSALLCLFALNNAAISLLTGATDTAQAALPTFLLAATSPATEPALLLAAVVLLKPDWLRGRWRWGWWLVYGLVFLPVLLTLADVGLGTQFWYTGLKDAVYTGGYVSLAQYCTGSLSRLIWALNFYTMPIVTIIPLLYIALRDKKGTPLTRRLAWLLLVAQIAGTAFQIGLRDLLSAEVRAVLTGTVFVIAYAYAAFQQMISERRVQRGRLQTRLTALISVVTIPILVALVALVSIRAGALIERHDVEALRAWQQFQQLAWTAVAVGAAMLLTLAWASIRQTLRPIGALTDTATAIAAGDLSRAAPVESEDEIGILARAFNNMTGQLGGLIGSLEQGVVERTRDLEQRSAYLAVAAEVGHVVTSMLNPDELPNQVVTLVCGRFNHYHGGLFLLDDTGHWAVYRAGTGEVGRTLLEQGFRLEVGGNSMIGWCTAHAQPRVAQDVSQETVRFPDPLLPNTRSEAALPLIARGRVIGALSVQSVKVGAFAQEEVTVLQMLANQIAVAIDNARLFAESQAALEATRRAYGELAGKAWTELLRVQPGWGYRSDGRSVTSTDVWQPEMEQAIREGQMVQCERDGAGDKLPLAIPIQVSGNTIGVLSTYKPRERGGWTPDEIAFLKQVTNQLALALDSARLYQDTQRHAARERLVGEVTARMRESLDLNQVLETAVNKISQALGLAALDVQLVTLEQKESQPTDAAR